MEFRGAKILECPVHLQKRLDQSPAQVAGDILSTRLTRKKRCKTELEDRALAASVRNQISPIPTKDVKTNDAPDIHSDSSSASVPVKPDLLRATLSGDETVRAPPAPTPPIYETVTWGDPPPKSTRGYPTKEDMKQQALNLIQRVPSSRWSLVDTGTRPMREIPISAVPPQVAIVDVPLLQSRSGSPLNDTVIGHAAPGAIHRNDTVGLHLPQLWSQRPLTRVTCTPTPVMDTLNATL